MEVKYLSGDLRVNRQEPYIRRWRLMNITYKASATRCYIAILYSRCSWKNGSGWRATCPGQNACMFTTNYMVTLCCLMFCIVLANVSTCIRSRYIWWAKVRKRFCDMSSFRCTTYVDHTQLVSIWSTSNKQGIGGSQQGAPPWLLGGMNLT